MKSAGPARTRSRVLACSKDALRFAACWALALLLALMPLPSAADGASPSSSSDKPASNAASDPLLQVIQAGLSPAKTELGKNAPRPYFIIHNHCHQNLAVL